MTRIISVGHLNLNEPASFAGLYDGTGAETSSADAGTPSAS